MKKWFSMQKTGETSAEITIYDSIGWYGVTASQFKDDLTALGPVTAIDLRINSPGGSVFDGLPMFELLRSHPAKVTAYVDGWAASMASVVAMAADEIVMADNAWMMIHNPATMTAGDHRQLRKDADLLEGIRNGAIRAYQLHANVEADEIARMMDYETWMTATDAVALGFATATSAPKQVAAHFNPDALSMFAHIPEGAKVFLDGAGAEPPAKEDDEPTKEDPDVDTPAADEPVEPPPSGEPAEPPADGGAVAVAYDEGLHAGEARAGEIVNALREERDRLAEELKAVTAAKDRLCAGMKADPDKDKFLTWPEATKALGYEKARREYPDLYSAFMREQRTGR